MVLILFFIILLLLALAPFMLWNVRTVGIVNSGGSVVLALASAICMFVPAARPASLFQFFYADALSWFFVLLIAAIYGAVSLYSISYIQGDVDDGVITFKQARLYYLLLNTFVFAMLLAVLVNNLGILWVAIELTTLVSAFLVGFYRSERSVEAAWKYIIVCSVGITFALFGTILFYYASVKLGGVGSLNWTGLMALAPNLDPKILKIAFLFIIIGYGTKAGFVPMHTWLPDAHSQALTPVSALLSGVLLPTALYAIIRFMLITNTALGQAFTGHLLILFGIASLAVACGFTLVQKDLKRLLAYSSIEHVGIIALGLGIGGPLGYFGALFHAFNHALTKSIMFFGAGNAVRKYQSHLMDRIQGMLQSMPFAGAFFTLGAFALAGSPPFSIFLSEAMIFIAGFSRGMYLLTSAAILFVAVIFGAIIHFSGRMVFGVKPSGMTVRSEPLSAKIAFVALGSLALVLGLYIPAFFSAAIESVVAIMTVR